MAFSVCSIIVKVVLQTSPPRPKPDFSFIREQEPRKSLILLFVVLCFLIVGMSLREETLWNKVAGAWRRAKKQKVKLNKAKRNRPPPCPSELFPPAPTHLACQPLERFPSDSRSSGRTLCLQAHRLNIRLRKVRTWANDNLT